MKQQVLVIHGGHNYKTYEEYLEKLKNKQLTLEDLRPNPDWKDTLQEDLGEDFDVLMPQFPNKQNAQYNEWKIVFEKVLAITDKDLILVGHSLGGMFLIKFLSENKLAKNVKGLFIIASPYKKTDLNDNLPRFAFTRDLNNLSNVSNNIYFIYSEDDVVVDFENLEKFRAELPNANYLVFEDRNHFFTPNSLPEMVELIKSVSK